MSLDVITVVSDSTPPQFVRQCRASVRAAAELCTYPVSYIESPGVLGHIGQAMRGGLAKSTAEYVAFVDDDDWVLPNAFLCLERHFAARPAAICAREIQLLASGVLVPQSHRHHLTAFRRSLVDSVDLSQFPTCGNVALHQAAQRESVADELSWVYVYRRRLSPGLKLRTTRSAQEKRALS